MEDLLLKEWIRKIHRVNVLEFLPRLPAESIDLIMTSPPY